MGVIEIDDRKLTIEHISQSQAEKAYRLRIRYRTAADSSPVTEVVDLPVDSRSDLNTLGVENQVSEWASTHPNAVILEYEISEEVVARRGTLVRDGTDSRSRDNDSESRKRHLSAATREQLDVLVPDHGYEIGDRVVYYEGGRTSSIYGYTTDGIVQDVPPLLMGKDGPSHVDRLLLNLGNQTRPIPLDWIVGRADDPDVEIDREREGL